MVVLIDSRNADHQQRLAMPERDRERVFALPVGNRLLPVLEQERPLVALHVRAKLLDEVHHPVGRLGVVPVAGVS